jgi:hypothetical protein
MKGSRVQIRLMFIYDVRVLLCVESGRNENNKVMKRDRKAERQRKKTVGQTRIVADSSYFILVIFYFYFICFVFL